MITDDTVDELVLTGHIYGMHAFFAQPLVDFTSQLCGEVLAHWVGPVISCGTANKHGTWRQRRDQGMLIDRLVILTIIEGFVCATEPVWEVSVDHFDRFSVATHR